MEQTFKNKEYDYSAEKQDLNDKLINGNKEMNIVQIERNKFLEELSNKERLISDLEKQLSDKVNQTQLNDNSKQMQKMKIEDLLKEIEQL